MSLAARRSHRGDEYQVAVAIHWLIQLIVDSRIETVEIEVVALPGDSEAVTVDDVVVSFGNSHRLFIQAKKSQPEQRAWAISDPLMREELLKALSQTEDRKDVRVEFWSHSPFSNLAKLIESHNDFATHSIFDAQAPQTLLSALTELSRVVGLPPANAFAWSRILGIGPHLDTAQWEARNRQDLASLTTDEAVAFDVLERMVRRRQAFSVSPIRRQDLVTELDRRGVSLLQRSAHLSPQDLVDRFAIASGSLLSCRSVLPDGQWIQRQELDTLQATLRSHNQSVTLVLGDPGSGKSALLARLGQSIRNSSGALLAIKADLLPEEVVDRASLTQFLELPDDVVACVRLLAHSRPVIVIVDQLDALADLVVQRSGRLRVLLQLVRDLSEQANVHVVVSCRSFEHRHDPRLRAIDADVLSLTLPTWEQVADVLIARGISASAWSEAIRNDLRSPHALDLFLQLVKDTDSSSLLEGYQQMLDALWWKHVLCDTSGGRRAAVIAIASMMAEREVLWLPQSRLDPFAQAISQLVAAGILVTEQGRLGFRHQTLYEFVRARDFVDGEGRLTEAVLARQKSVRVRPVLWHALGYMRSVDPAGYQRELEKLWGATLRPHLRGLLIDFMGQAQVLLPAETRLVLEIADDIKWRPRVLASTAGSAGWFCCLQKHVVPEVMNLEPDDARICLPVLVGGAAVDPDAVRSLIDRHWLPHERYDSLTIFLLEQLPQWSGEDADRFARIASRTAVEPWSISAIATRMSESLPERAPRVIRLWLDRLERNSDIVTAEGQDIDGSESLRNRLIRLLTGHELHDLPAVAEAAPTAFLSELWPWFVSTVGQLGADYQDEAMYTRESVGIDLWDDERQSGERPVVDAFVSAIEALAKSDPGRFIEFAGQYGGTDQMIVQRLLAQGMKLITVSRPDEVADFLLADERRLLLGSFSRPSADTKELIRSVMPLLDPTKRREIETMVRDWDRWQNHPEDDAKTRMARRTWNREHRLRLLRAFPDECLSDDLRKHLIEEERALGDVDEGERRGFEMTEVCSPVNADQMALAQDEHILQIFREIDDSQAWGISARSRRPLGRSGGAIQAGRELEKLTKADPDRGVRIALQLTPGMNEIPAGFVVRALSEDASHAEKLYDLIEKLVSKGFCSRGFAADVASAVQTASGSIFPPQSIVEILRAWLRGSPAVDTAGSEQGADEGKPYVLEDARSFLWGGDLMVVLPSGNFPLLSAVSHLLLNEEPPDINRWVEAIEEHLQKPESWHVWAALWSHLVNLHLVERARAVGVIDRLLSRYPDMFVCRQGVILLAHAQRWAPSADVQRWVACIIDQASPRADQVAGELATLHSIASDGSPWAREIVDLACVPDPFCTPSEALRLGVAFAIAELWAEPSFRATAHPPLVALMRIGSTPVLRALDSVYDPKSFGPNPSCVELLDLLVERPEIGAASIDRVTECLLEMATYEPVRVFRATLSLLNACHSSVRSIASVQYLAGENLVQIALTLQEQGDEVAEMAADLFERLLELRIPYADELLLDLDKRTTNTRTPSRAGRPRRRVKSKWTSH
jgi:ABC-type cobalamin/Fe3+-siderophores transport system ATPase subunit